MTLTRRVWLHAVALVACGFWSGSTVLAQAPSYQPAGQPVALDYAGPREALTTPPLVDPGVTGRSSNPKVNVVGEVRKPGSYSLSDAMRLVEAMALAGSTLPSASGEAVIVPAGAGSMMVTSSRASAAGGAAGSDPVTRVNLRRLQEGSVLQNVALKDGDTVFVLRADNIYVLGQVGKPGAYPLHQEVTTVLQGLALAGGMAGRGTPSRLEILRAVDGKQKKIKVKMHDLLQPGDTLLVGERRFF